jgi:hypothetical protein
MISLGRAGGAGWRSVMTAFLCRLSGMPPNRAVSGFLPGRSCRASKQVRGPCGVAIVVLCLRAVLATVVRCFAASVLSMDVSAALVTVYDAEPAERRPHDVIAPPGGRHGAREPRPGPSALAKWLAGSVRRDPGEVIAAAFDEAGARDPGRLRTWVVLVDGAERQLDLIRAEAARRDAEIHVIIDIIHVLDLSTVPARESHVFAVHIVVAIDVTLARR